jgi:hypothetical protein
MKPPIQFTCCVCHEPVLGDDEDSYGLQVTKVGANSPELLKGHGTCLRRVIPVLGEEIPKPHQP